MPPANSSPTHPEPTATEAIELRIASTWDGRPAAVTELATVRVLGDKLGLTVQVEAPFHGDPPPPGPPGATPGLWDFEVVELFVAGGPEATQYLEIELSPHGHHLAIRLEGIRHPVEQRMPLAYTARLNRPAGRWSGEARVPASWLPPPPHRVNAFALHGRGETRRFLAATALPGERPDFHQPRHFPLRELPLR